ncbi:hypothetical protein CRG98_040104 [Punica granatum]|uniref:Bifunctional inhibitor/plant lipid transfer protein/seed storage helical domain-containing protein n=1 Tax=Punica granatum TaxID=22663 RepID=A0A2I0I674_PUNGR|nr:hypothetical protein CRG98_040104 [Punica granatum]
MEIGLVAVLVVAAATLWAGAVAQSSSDCTNVLISMSPCLNYISGNSSTPSTNCCSQLASVVRSQPQCLCQGRVQFTFPNRLLRLPFWPVKLRTRKCFSGRFAYWNSFHCSFR